MLENRLRAGNDLGPLENGPSSSILGTMRAASDAGQALVTPTGIRGGSTVARQSNLLGRTMLAGTIPGEGQRELQAGGSSGGFQLAMAVGRLNILDAGGDTSGSSRRMQEGSDASVLGLIASGDSDPDEMAAIARRYCSGTASDFVAGETDDSFGAEGGAFGVALVDAAARIRRRALQTGNTDLLQGVDATAMEWGGGADTVASPFSTDSAGLGDALGIPIGEQNTTQGSFTTPGQNSLVESNRTVESTTETLSAEQGSTVSVDLTSSASGSPVGFEAQDLEACVFVPKPASPPVPEDYRNQSVPVATLSGDGPSGVPQPNSTADLSALDVPQTCDEIRAVNRSEPPKEQVFESESVS